MAINKALWTLFFIIFVDFFQLFFVIPLLPSLVSSFGGAAEQITSKVALLVTLGNVAEAIGSPIVGKLSDRFGRRSVMMLATFGGAVSASVFGFSRNFYEAAVARVVMGLCGSTMGVAQTYVTDVTTEEERPTAQNRVTASFSLGLMAGPAVGGILYSWVGIEIACLSAGAISLINLLCVVLFLRETAPALRSAREVDLLQCEQGQQGEQGDASQESNGRATFPCTIWILFTAWTAFSPIMVVFDAYVVLYLRDKYFKGDTKHATQFNSCCATAAGAVIFLVAVWLYDPIFRRLGFNRTCILGGLLGGVGFTGMGLLPGSLGPEAFFISSVMMCFGIQLVYPAIPTLIGKLAPPERIGEAFGINNSCGNWAGVVAPLVFAPLFGLWQSSVWLVAAMLFITASAVVLLVSIMSNSTDSLSTEQPPECNVGTLIRQTSIPGSIREQLLLTSKGALVRAVTDSSQGANHTQRSHKQSSHLSALSRSQSGP